ncbi:glycosyltransferase family 2 protein [Winogradskyella ludwigii]|uniref:glycosyltransferase family 2 protein n=1 Tax=Winogradskyella ludwigii TaxID=2686076 RepID=UPI0015C6C81B|nr:glycosyltransferase family 2 protein [Winogradskyella ludwigii]
MTNTYIIIVTYNGMQWLEKCLKSCANYPVIIVDNASTDDTVSFIETNYPNVVLFKQAENLGFGQANNLGIRYALDQGAEHVFLLNQDAYIVDTVLENLIANQKEHPDYGILSPIHITRNMKKMDRLFNNYMRKEKSGMFYSDFVLGNKLASVYEVPFVNAASWLVSRKCIEIVGGFDPLFFHYGEDDNYCQRVQYHGFKVGVLPKEYVIHDREERKSTKPKLFTSEYYRNIEKIYKVEFANINIDNKLDSQVYKHRKMILKFQLQFKFANANSIKYELLILNRIKPLIIKSRYVNTVKGKHYL